MTLVLTSRSLRQTNLAQSGSSGGMDAVSLRGKCTCRLLLLDMVLGNQDRLPLDSLGWRGNPGNLLFCPRGEFRDRTVAIDSLVQRRPPGALSLFDSVAAAHDCLVDNRDVQPLFCGLSCQLAFARHWEFSAPRQPPFCTHARLMSSVRQGRATACVPVHACCRA